MRSRILIYAGLIAVNLVVYGQTARFDFAFDDRYYIDQNELVKAGLSRHNFVWAWTTTYFVNWHPLTWLSFMLDAELFGPEPGGFHVTNLIWHTANTLLLFAVLESMTGAVWRSAVVAALFAVHPLHVESVAWISGRKDLISTFFGLAAIAAYARYARRFDWKWYAMGLAFFALSLCAKQMLVTLPCLLLLLDYWPLGRTPPAAGEALSVQDDVAVSRARLDAGSSVGPRQSWSRLLVEKLPFFVMSAVFSAVVVAAQSGGGAVRDLEEFSLATRLGNALLVYVLYLKMMLWPTGLAVFYPHPGAAISWPPVALAAAVLILLSGICLCLARRRPYLLVGWLWYLGTLVPVIGLVQVGTQQMADRYTYVPLIGPFLAATWLLSSVVSRPEQRRLPVAVFAGSILLVLTALAWRQTRLWRNNVDLFEHTLAMTENNKVAHNNLGFALEKVQRYAEAKHHYEQALKLDPEYAFAHYNMGTLLLKQKDHAQAARHYETTLSIMPHYQPAHYFLGVALEQLGQSGEAEAHYRQAPDTSDAHYNLAVLLERQGRFDEAIQRYRDAIRLNPKLTDAHFNLANTFAQRGRLSEATHHYRKAVQIDPEFAAAEYNLSVALSEQGRFAEAAEHARRCLQIDPQNAVAHNHLGTLYASMDGRESSAIEHFRQALALAPDFAEAEENLRRVLHRQPASTPEAPHESALQ